MRMIMADSSFWPIAGQVGDYPSHYTKRADVVVRVSAEHMHHNMSSLLCLPVTLQKG